MEINPTRCATPRSLGWLLCHGLVCYLVAQTLAAQAPPFSVALTINAQGQPQRTFFQGGNRVPSRNPEYHPSRVLVKFRNGERPFLPGSGPVRSFPLDDRLFLVNNPPRLSVPEVIQRYQANPNVLYAEPDFVVHATATPNDPLWSQQWDMTKISAPTAWDTQTDASDVVVAIIDTGIDFTHPDLQANLWTNPADGSHGFDCITEDVYFNFDPGCVPGGQDDMGHGTHVAGTIGAVGNNGIGIAGINWKVKLLAMKFLDGNGNGNTSDAVYAFNKVALLKLQGVNIRVTNNSWGFEGGLSQALKDAMTIAEGVGIVNVCAAGNLGKNTDLFPMYPAAYDNRGIISVLASDSNDLGADFTNYSLASVDIAAPGVSTLSTIPAFWDPSGYTLLSGTSMATPHVSGVLAALFHKNPQLTAAQARDVILNPGSYDVLSDPLAASTSTGGRLNFAKALNNPFLFSPVLNNFPTLAVGGNIFASAGSQVTLGAVGSDPDSDPLRFGWSKESSDISASWLLGWMLDNVFPTPTGTSFTSSFSFTAPSLARTANVPYLASVADGHGGGATGLDNLTVAPAAHPGAPPSGTLSVSATDVPVETEITINFPVTDPEGTATAWELAVASQYGLDVTCCYTSSSTTGTFYDAGVYRVSAQAMDQELNLSTRPSVVVRVGGATGIPPIVSATLDKLSGPVPLTVNIDMGASTDPDGAIESYAMLCGNGAQSFGSTGSCTYTVPGTYWVQLYVNDTAGNYDFRSAYVVATPVDKRRQGQLVSE
jgi:subtilisin family serine protease